MLAGMNAEAKLATRVNVSTASASVNVIGTPTARRISHASAAMQPNATTLGGAQDHEPAAVAADELDELTPDTRDEAPDLRPTAMCVPAERSAARTPSADTSRAAQDHRRPPTAITPAPIAKPRKIFTHSGGEAGSRSPAIDPNADDRRWCR